jgi:hypothetical protein
MKVMSYIGAITRIPDHYLLHCWCLPPPDIVAPVVEHTPKPTTKMSRKNMRLLRYGNLCNEFSRRAIALAASEQTKEIAEKHMLAMDRDLAELKKSNAAALKRKKRKKNAEYSTDAGDDGGSQTMKEGAGPTIQQSDLSANRKAKDPTKSKIKGRPVSKRKKSGLHLSKPHPTACSVCNELGHVARNCPVRLANPEKYPIKSIFHK